MKNSIKLIGAALILASAFTSCHDDAKLLGGEGTLIVKATLNSDVKVNSRATVEELSQTCQIYISNAKGPVRKYVGIENVPTGGIKLVADHYIAEAWAGDSVPASFDDRWFKGSEEFDITSGDVTNVNLVCKIANTAASVVYAENIDELLSDYTMTIGHSAGTLTWEGRDLRRGYFMMTPTRKDLEYTLTGTRPNGETYTRKGVIQNAKPATEYILNVKYNGVDAEIGGGYFTIEIDEKAIEVNSEVVIALSPEIAGYDFDIDKELVAEQGKAGRRAVMVYGSAQLSNVVLTSNVLVDKLGLAGDDVDLMTMTDAIKTSLENGGINTIYNYDATEDNSWLKINFEETLLNSLEEGTYTFDVHATDVNNKESKATFTLYLTNASVTANEAVAADVWATSATITGNILKPEATNPILRYRQVGQTAWIDAVTNVSGSTLSANLTDLTPGVTYEYIAAADGFTSADIKTFTTEAALQLPNAGFEDWSKDGSIQLPFGAGQSKFWDSGNHGSATMNKNVTVPSSDKKHSGNYSAQLNSQFVGLGSLGKFAAGNIFIGEYLATVGTNGVLGWGRSWTSRPKALKGYVHYTPVAVTHTATIPGVTLNVGDMDQGIIYIAVLDGSIVKDYEGKNYPVVIKTKEKEFFSKDDSNVIAYGELVLTEATAGTDMVEFNIPLEYVKTDAKSVYVMIVGSASRYGDYFAGGNGSTMFLDDLELVY